jgi:2-dehydro-3-deoxyphosphogluconate aldolase / (4S)-4-hydroxy-2-oxoglutarate aldolase
MDVDKIAKVSAVQADNVVREVGRTRIVAILRGDLKGKAVEVVQTLIDAGISAVEVTLNSPHPFDTIAEIRDSIRSPFVLGAGTVLHSDEVAKAFDHGAQFIVSPNMSPVVIQTTKKLGMASFPGCATCSEIIRAFEYGADAAKLFPAIIFPPEGVHAILASLGSMRLIPTGGITLKNAAQYLTAGAWALGVGGALVDVSKVESMSDLRIRAIEFADAATTRRG